MGVTGLWRLIDPAGKPVPVETLENKVLAVDISIWLHQMVKGYQDAKGAPLANAHLIGLFQRLCKLLYFRIKPIFVFDGAFPDLKKETIAKRQDNKLKYNSESERLKRELALLLGKKTAVSSLLGIQISPKKSQNGTGTNDDDIFKLPALPQKDEETESGSEEEESTHGTIDLHSVDIESDNFKSLPVKEKYELLVELKETRKMNSWGRLHELPKKSDNFSDFQLQRLLKRRKVQECLQETEKEIGDTGMSLVELESLLNEEGIDTKIESLPTRRIASNDTTRILLINNVRQALAEAKKKKEETKVIISKSEKDLITEDKTVEKKDELDEDLEKAIKMSLECVDEVQATPDVSKTDDSWTSALTDTDYSDSEEDGSFDPPDMSTAKAYIMQYSDYTNNFIEKIVSTESKMRKKYNLPKVNDIIEELNNAKPVIVDNVALLSSDDDDCVMESLHCNLKRSESENSNIPKEIDTNIDRQKNNIDQNKSIIDLVDKTGELESSENRMDLTQSSVELVVNHVNETITLESSCEEDKRLLANETPLSTKSANSNGGFEEVPEKVLYPKTNIKVESKLSDDESSDDGGEFEEVPDEDVDIRTNKPVVEFTVNIGKAPDDDIFADIFCAKEDIKPSTVHSDYEFLAVPSTSGYKPVNKVKTDNVESQNHITSQKETGAIEIEQHKTEFEIIKPKNKLKVTLNENNKNVKTDNVESKVNINSQKETDVIEQHKTEFDIIKQNKNNTATINDTVNESMDTEVLQSTPRDPITIEKLNSMVEEIQTEEQDLQQEKGRLDRIGRNITEQMTKEAQELLQIFGIPYIVAPMEAEAQCAFLESVKLTDGTITDDSDIWLFGGRTVYKNFFNQKKHVLQFLADRIERSFNLSREQLILLALLVGSDYTTGIAGVGPVTAMEILASFPFNKKQLLNEPSKQSRYSQIVSGLQEFKKWVKAGKRTDNITLKKKLKNVDVTDDFPSVRVVQAYLEPNVEKSEDKFTWGAIDITILRDYTKSKFGWSQNKLDEIIKPVLKRILDRKSQKTVHDYFKRKIEFGDLEDQMSKRVKAAVQKMGPEPLIEEESVTKETKAVKKRKAKNKTETGVSSKPKQATCSEESVLNEHGVKVVSQIQDGKTSIQITIPKTDRFQEIIPQREKVKKNLLENKMKAIELFRKTKIDRKRKPVKKRVNLPKDKAELSESSNSD